MNNPMAASLIKAFMREGEYKALHARTFKAKKFYEGIAIVCKDLLSSQFEIRDAEVIMVAKKINKEIK